MPRKYIKQTKTGFRVGKKLSKKNSKKKARSRRKLSKCIKKRGGSGMRLNPILVEPSSPILVESSPPPSPRAAAAAASPNIVERVLSRPINNGSGFRQKTTLQKLDSHNIGQGNNIEISSRIKPLQELSGRVYIIHAHGAKEPPGPPQPLQAPIVKYPYKIPLNVNIATITKCGDIFVIPKHKDDSTSINIMTGICRNKYSDFFWNFGGETMNNIYFSNYKSFPQGVNFNAAIYKCATIEGKNNNVIYQESQLKKIVDLENTNGRLGGKAFKGYLNLTDVVDACMIDSDSNPFTLICASCQA